VVTDEQREWLQHRAFQSAPFEACGFVMDDGSIIEIRNVAPNPAKGFEMDRLQLVEKISDKVSSIVAIWHTHPSGKAAPSKRDLESMRCGAVHRHWLYLVATKDEVTEWITEDYAPQDDSFWGQFIA
jgi:proteasome lid subunit RPN8/RPN11